jgi:PIN domain nuclease of toxin-antitoxin system
MRLLLDTHVFIWAVVGSPRLISKTRAQIEAAEAVYVSAASIWEIAIKARLGKIEGDAQALVDAIDASGFHELAVTARHAAAVEKLPLHHADPFDRLLLAQAFSEPLHLLTADRELAAYGGGVTTL